MKTSQHRRDIVKRSREKNKHKYVDKKKKSDNAYYKKNKSAVRKKQGVYRDKNRDRINKQSQAINKARLRTDQAFALTCLMRTRIGNYLRNIGKKKALTFKLIGCSKDELKAHLGDKKGHIDHIFPLARYNKDTEQFIMTRWENLQMLTAEENKEKRDMLPTKEMARKVPLHVWPSGVTYDMLPDIYPGWATALSKH